MSFGGNKKGSSVTRPPREFRPFFGQIFNNAFEASRQAAVGSRSFGGPSFAGVPQTPFTTGAPGVTSVFGSQLPTTSPNSVLSTRRNTGPSNEQLQANFGPFTTQTSGTRGERTLNKITENVQTGAPGSFPLPFNAPGVRASIKAGHVVPTELLTGGSFPGPFIAPANPLELETAAGTEQLARRLQGVGSPLLGLGQAQALGAFLSPESNPFLNSTIQAAINPVFDAFSNVVLPSFDSAAINAGAFKGSSARDFAQNQLAQSVSGQAFDIAAQLANANLARERALQAQTTPGLLQAGVGLQTTPTELLGLAGQQVRNLQQVGIDERLAQFQESLMAPFRPLQPLTQLIAGQPIGQKTRSIGPQPSEASQILSGVMGAITGTGTLTSIMGALKGNTGGGTP